MQRSQQVFQQPSPTGCKWAIASASSNAKPRLLSNFTTFVDRLFEFVKMNTTRVRGSRVQCDFGYDTA
jgi:hypothetical protein